MYSSAEFFRHALHYFGTFFFSACSDTVSGTASIKPEVGVTAKMPGRTMANTQVRERMVGRNTAGLRAGNARTIWSHPQLRVALLEDVSHLLHQLRGELLLTQVVIRLDDDGLQACTRTAQPPTA